MANEPSTKPKITLKVKVDNILQMITNKVTSWSNTPSNDNYPSEKLVKDSLDGKANLSHNHDDRYYTESEIVNFLNKKIDLDCEFINGWWNSNQTYNLRGKSVKDLNTLRRDGKKFIYKVPDFSDMGYDDNELYLKLETSNSTYGVIGKLYYNENTIYVKDAKTLFMNKYLLIEHIQNGTFDEYHILDIFNIFHNHNDVYYTKSEMDNKIITDVSGLTDNQGLLFSGSYNDLTNKPTIPSNTSDLNNDSGFITDSDIVDKEDISNKVTDLSSVLSDDNDSYPTANAVKDGIEVVSNELDDFSNKLGDIDYIYSQIRNSVFNTDSVYGDDLTLWYKLYYDMNDDKLYCNNRGDIYDEIATLYSLINYVQKSQTDGLLKNDGTIVQSGTGANNWATGNHTHDEYIKNQEYYFDGDDFVVISNEETITKTLTIVWNDNDDASGLRPRYLQPTINGITAYLSEESDWSVSIPVDTEDTYNWSVPSVLGYNSPIFNVVDNLTTVTFRIRTQPTPPTPSV